MPKPDMTYLSTVIADLSGVPVRIYENGKQTFFHFFSELKKDPFVLHRDVILSADTPVGYYATETLSYYGFVSFGNAKMIIGPTGQTPVSDQDLKTLAFYLEIPSDETDAFLSGMKSIIRMPIESVLQILCVLNYVLNGEKLGLSDIQIFADEQERLQKQTEDARNARIIDPNPTEPAFAGATHNTTTIEDTLMNIISHGDVTALEQWLGEAPAVRGGTLATEQLRQRKNTFIVTATLASRAAIRGGLSADEALSLSDQFIQNCELLTTPNQIVNLQVHMIMEFTKRVQRIRIGGNPSKLSTQVSNYIQHHLSEPIRVEDLAKELYISRPHLSKKFVRETGMTLTDYILKEKTEEAKRLLRYTDKTATAISIYLGFSSLGHFSRVFLKHTGLTPHEYRLKHAKG